jgi:hypothetical protein
VVRLCSGRRSSKFPEFFMTGFVFICEHLLNFNIIDVLLDYNYLLICISTHNGMENVKIIFLDE